MTTGEKLAALRRKNGMTQDGLAEILEVSRQAVSRWEIDAAFPETEKLIRLSRLFGCSIDFLLNNEMQKQEAQATGPGARECFHFIRECGYFFLATSVDNRPRLRPLGFIYTDDRALYIATDTRKHVYAELNQNPAIEMASYNLNTRRWLRLSGSAERYESAAVRDGLKMLYPMIRQEYIGENEIYLVIFRINAKSAYID